MVMYSRMSVGTLSTFSKIPTICPAVKKFGRYKTGVLWSICKQRVFKMLMNLQNFEGVFNTNSIDKISGSAVSVGGGGSASEMNITNNVTKLQEQHQPTVVSSGSILQDFHFIN